MRITNLLIPLDIVVGKTPLILLGVTPYFEYQNGKKTDNKIGYKYLVVEMKNFEKFSVKVPSTQPVITAEQLSETKEKLQISFTNAVAKPYRTINGDYDLSISAESANITK